MERWNSMLWRYSPERFSRYSELESAAAEPLEAERQLLHTDIEIV
jgi:hypothetical protein